MKRLFRKVGDQSASFIHGPASIRTDGTYIYEEFIPTEGTDVKVYTIGEHPPRGPPISSFWPPPPQSNRQPALASTSH